MPDRRLSTRAVEKADRLAEDGDGAALASVPTADRLLDTAATLFRRKGYAQSTTRELAELLGIQKASLYYHMKSKEDLLYALSIESLKRMQVEVAATAEASAPETRLRSMIATHVAVALRDRDMHTVMLIELRSLSASRRDAVIKRRSDYQRLLQNVIADDQAAGRLRTDTDAEYLTLVLLNILNWTIFWFRPDGPLTVSGLAELLGAIFIEGAAGRDPADGFAPLALDAAFQAGPRQVSDNPMSGRGEQQ